MAPRVDSQASSERTGIGGWFPHRRQDGKIDVRGSRWFSLELNEEEWPWVYAWGRKPALIISSLESLAAIVAPKILYGETSTGETHESSDSADDYGQSAHGTGIIHEKDDPADGCGVGASRGKQRGGQARERQCRILRPELENRRQR